MQLHDKVVADFESMVKVCRKLGSEFYARMLEHAVEDLRADGHQSVVWRLCNDFEGDGEKTFMPIRMLGGLHYQVLQERAPELAKYFPSIEGGHPEWPQAWTAARTLIVRDMVFFRQFLDRPPQTNEISRAGCLVPGLLFASAQFGYTLPLAQIEFGSSAGLLLRLHTFRYDWGPWQWGDPASAAVVRTAWRSTKPPPAELTKAPPSLNIVSRAGCDIMPLDLSQAETRTLLSAYVWPDMNDRRTLLRAVLAAVASDQQNLVAIEKKSAAEFLREQLSAWKERLGSSPPVLTVLQHSYVWCYIGAEERKNIIEQMNHAGLLATRTHPLGWLRMEDSDDGHQCELRLRLWPDGNDHLLAVCQSHGQWIEWVHG